MHSRTILSNVSSVLSTSFATFGNGIRVSGTRVCVCVCVCGRVGMSVCSYSCSYGCSYGCALDVLAAVRIFSYACIDLFAGKSKKSLPWIEIINENGLAETCATLYLILKKG